MKEYYVILTGSKNNAGDFLIKHRAKRLFAALRPDRDVIDLDGWKPFTEKELELVNRAKALVLMGGPALQPHMRPRIYPMTSDLNSIKVPVIMMGTGYKDHNGSWAHIADYKLEPATLELLKKINGSGYISSVRDYHTLDLLLYHGFTRVMMTGCPALYDLDHIHKEPLYPAELKQAAFSLGVSYIDSRNMDELMKRTMKELQGHFGADHFCVYFHHSINRQVPQQAAMVDWLERNGIRYKDISGSAEGLISSYSAADVHIGFRVHSHIFSCSVSKPSLLYSEDGRGKALHTVIGGIILDAYTMSPNPFITKVKRKLGAYTDPYIAYRHLPADTLNNLQNETEQGFPRMRVTRANIDLHFEQMKKFMSQLP